MVMTFWSGPTCTEPQKHQAKDHEQAPCGYEPPRAMAVEDGADLDANEEDDEQVQAKDPANLGGIVVLELVFGEVRLEDGGGVDETEYAHHGAKGSHDSQPTGTTTFWEGQGGGARHARGNTLRQTRGDLRIMAPIISRGCGVRAQVVGTTAVAAGMVVVMVLIFDGAEVRVVFVMDRMQFL